MPPAPAAMAIFAASVTEGSNPPREFRSTATLFTFTLNSVITHSENVWVLIINQDKQ
jgi:hypothetical protein